MIPFSVFNHIFPTFLFAACDAARNAKDIGHDTQNLKQSDEYAKYNYHVINAVINSVTFLEANINAFLVEIRDHGNIPDSLNIRQGSPQNTHIIDSVRQKVRANEQDATNRRDRWDYLDLKAKYDMALEVLDQSQRERIYQKKPGQDIGVLINFRNYLVHYKVEAQTPPTVQFSRSPRSNYQKLIQQLNSNNHPHPLKIEGDLFANAFPDSHLSHDCAKWAVLTAKEFAEEFYQCFGMQSPHEDSSYSQFLRLW